MTWKSEPWLVLDLETTGVPAGEHHPIEIGFVRVVDGVETAEATYRVRPPIPIPEEASAVHGICDQDVQNCPSLEDVAAEIVEIIQEQRVIVAYNGYDYDFPMLRDRCPGFYEACRGRVFLDPLVLVRTDTVGRFWRNRDRWNPERGRHTLENAAVASGLDIDPSALHGALGDCRLTAGILRRWMSRLPDDGREAQRALVEARRAQEDARREYRQRNALSDS